MLRTLLVPKADVAVDCIVYEKATIVLLVLQTDDSVRKTNHDFQKQKSRFGYETGRVDKNNLGFSNVYDNLYPWVTIVHASVHYNVI